MFESTPTPYVLATWALRTQVGLMHSYNYSYKCAASSTGCAELQQKTSQQCETDLAQEPQRRRVLLLCLSKLWHSMVLQREPLLKLQRVATSSSNSKPHTDACQCAAGNTSMHKCRTRPNSSNSSNSIASMQSCITIPDCDVQICRAGPT